MMSHRNMKWRELANDATATCILLWSLHFLSYLTFIISTHRFYLFSSFHSHPTVHTTLQAQICPLSELRFNSHIPSVHALVWMNNALQFPLRGITNKCSETKKKKKIKEEPACAEKASPKHPVSLQVTPQRQSQPWTQTTTSRGPERSSQSSFK